MKQKIIILFLFLLIAAFALFLAKSKNNNQVPIGGAFDLINVNGKKVTNQDLKGKYSIMFFGFTNCMMICPNALSSITEVASRLTQKQLNKLNLVFISVDPDRDTAPVLKDYMEAFHENFIALTGNKQQIDQLKENYKIFAKKHFLSEDNYVVNHSMIIYLFDKKGRYVNHYNHDVEIGYLFNSLNEIL